MMRFIRSAFVIARRDFTATVLSKAFIFFLLGPLFPLLFGGVFAGIGTNVASQAKRPVVAVIAPKAEFDRLQAARGRLAEAVGEDPLVDLVGYRPEADLSVQQKRLLATRQPPVRAVLSGGIDRPKLVGALAADPGTVGQLRLLISEARSPDAAGAPELEVTNVAASTGTLDRDRALTAQLSQVALFLLTLMLSTMVLSQLIEEKSNKVIEIIAAAIPIDAMFVGKLFAMLSASVLGLVVWISSGALLIQLVKHGGVATLPVPAVGWPMFLGLGVIYFAIEKNGVVETDTRYGYNVGDRNHHAEEALLANLQAELGSTVTWRPIAIFTERQPCSGTCLPAIKTVVTSKAKGHDVPIYYISTYPGADINSIKNWWRAA